jgi:hypothetical protein
MKIAKVYLPMILLMLGSLMVAARTVQVHKDKEIMLSQIKLKEVSDHRADAPVPDADLIAAKLIIEGFASYYKLPLDIKLEKHCIKMSAASQTASTQAPDDKEEGEKPENKKKDGANKFAVLDNFDNMLAFFNALSSLPYPLEYKELCVGVDCTEGFTATLGPKGSAGAAGSSAPGAPAPGAAPAQTSTQK